MKKIRVGAAIAAVSAALTLGVGAPAQATASAQQCVGNVVTGSVSCGTDKADVTANHVLLVRLYTGRGYSGSVLSLYGDHRCTTALDREYYKYTLPRLFNNNIESLISYNNCATKLFNYPYLGGASSPWFLSPRNLGAWGWNNAASSLRIS